jgi:hypothetical protein
MCSRHWPALDGTAQVGRRQGVDGRWHGASVSGCSVWLIGGPGNALCEHAAHRLVG